MKLNLNIEEDASFRCTFYSLENVATASIQLCDLKCAIKCERCH